MIPFMDENFLLHTDTARELFHDAAKDMPIYDYHCHLIPAQIAENKQFRSITELMLGGDHYKWRLMLANGVDESLIRGNGDDKEKFRAFAASLRRAIGNPVYHWTHLELQRVFGIYDVLNEDTADAIYDKATAMLQQEDFRGQRLIDKFNVHTLCTTDDPVDDLHFHKQIMDEGTLKARVLPAFRPDKAINIDRAGYHDYIKRLEKVSGVTIRSAEDVLEALETRIDYFHSCGARLSDHALDTVPFGKMDWGKANKAFRAVMDGDSADKKQIESYKTMLLVGLGELYSKRGWTQQYHIAAMRNNNTAMFRACGPDVGFDSINDEPIAVKLARLMDAQAEKDALPKTILYSLNAAANSAIASMTGNFQQSGILGKIQMGSAWWFLDNKNGMTEQIKSLCDMGVLANFVGMLTDSRSFISYPRHEYFRRILCSFIGDLVEKGEYPNDIEFLKTVVRDISFNNANRYFNM